MKSRFNPVLFDLDGTLIDSSRDIAEAVNYTLKTLGLGPLAHDQIVSYIGDGVRHLMERSLRPFGITDTDNAVNILRAYYYENCLKHTILYDGMLAFLENISDSMLGVVTNKPRGIADKILQGLDVKHLFKVVVGGDEPKRIKPAPDPIFLACERLQISPQEGIMIGDITNDIMAGQAAGMLTCGVRWGFDLGASFAKSSPDYIVDNVCQLRDVIGQ